MTTGERVKALRIKQGLSISQLAKLLGKDRTTVYRYETDYIENMPITVMEPLAKALGTTPSYLMGWEDEDIFQFENIKPIGRKTIPLLGRIACGEPIYADETKGCYIEADSKLEADFCLIATGDSMINARIHEGDVVFIKSQPIVENGEIAAIIIDDSATLKRVYYYPEKQKIILSAENPKYEPLVYIGDELQYVRILGKAVAFQSLI